MVLLAAGESRRLGEPKQLVVVDGEPLVRRAALAAIETRPAQALIVVGARAEAVWGGGGPAAYPRPMRRLVEGLSASIRAALLTIDSHVGAALFVLCNPRSARRICYRWSSAGVRIRDARRQASMRAVGVPAVYRALGSRD